jgi:hypothetical protein
MQLSEVHQPWLRPGVTPGLDRDAAAPPDRRSHDSRHQQRAAQRRRATVIFGECIPNLVRKTLQFTRKRVSITLHRYAGATLNPSIQAHRSEHEFGPPIDQGRLPVGVQAGSCLR